MCIRDSRYAVAYEKLEQFNAKFPEDMKKSILQYAIQGQLVEQRPEEGTGEELYQQIQAEKQRLIAEKKIKKEKPLAEISEDEIPFDIPESWKWVRIPEIGTSSLGKTLNKSIDAGKEVNYLCSINVYWEGINLDQVKTAKFSAVDIEKYLLQRGDLLVCEGGDVGRSAVWDSDTEMYYQKDVYKRQKYSNRGDFETAYTEFDSDNQSIQKIRIWYPKELENTNKKYPMILVVNASSTRAVNYKPFFDRLASWGFIVVGNDDPQTGTGETASKTLDFVLSLGTESVLSDKINQENIAIIGYSQGGAGALAAVTKYENGKTYKTIFTGSAAYPLLATNMGWDYDISKIRIPYFMVAGTGKSDDAGVEDVTKEFAGVSPLKDMIEIYEKIPEDVAKIRARASGAEHEDMLERSDGYMTAWMLYQLYGDEEAKKAFVGEQAEILTNTNWQDIEKNQ